MYISLNSGFILHDLIIFSSLVGQGMEGRIVFFKDNNPNWFIIIKTRWASEHVNRLYSEYCIQALPITAITHMSTRWQQLLFVENGLISFTLWVVLRIFPYFYILNRKRYCIIYYPYFYIGSYISIVKM